MKLYIDIVEISGPPKAIFLNKSINNSRNYKKVIFDAHRQWVATECWLTFSWVKVKWAL